MTGSPDPRFESTSASGAMLARASAPILLGVTLLAAPGTSSGAPPSAALERTRAPVRLDEPTSAGAPVAPGEGAGARIAELRRLSGFTWEQIGRLFGVSRRAVHFWASGKTMTPANEERLNRVLATLRVVDRGSATANRAALLEPQGDGTIPFDLLARGELDRVVALLGSDALPRRGRSAASSKAASARAPRPPGELVGALQDRVHRDKGVTRTARSVKVRGGN